MNPSQKGRVMLELIIGAFIVNSIVDSALIAHLLKKEKKN